MGFSDADMMGRGGKTGSGRMSSESQENQMRRERLRKLALETIDLNKDPYFMRNHLGTYECKLCLTIHTNEGNYLAHTQGKRHQQNIARRIAKDAYESAGPQAAMGAAKPGRAKTAKVGRPGYRVTKQMDPETKQHSLLFLIDYPEVTPSLSRATCPDRCLYRGIPSLLSSTACREKRLLEVGCENDGVCGRGVGGCRSRRGCSRAIASCRRTSSAWSPRTATTSTSSSPPSPTRTSPSRCRTARSTPTPPSSSPTGTAITSPSRSRSTSKTSPRVRA